MPLSWNEIRDRSVAERVAFLFAVYQKYTSSFPAAKPVRGRRLRAAQRARKGVKSGS